MFLYVGGAGFVLGCLVLVACVRTSLARTRPNLLLIVSDTLRADTVNCEDESIRTPNLCALAQRGVKFDRAYSHAPGTLRSSVAMFTGNHSSTYARTEDAEDLGEGHSLLHVPDDEQLLAESLRDSGYDTPAFVQNRLAAASNAMQGFRLLDREYIRTIDIPALETRLDVDLSIASARGLAGSMDYLLGASESFYLVQWITDPHAIYSPPEKLLAEIGVDPERLPHPLDFYRRLGHFNRPGKQLFKLLDELPNLTPYEKTFLRKLYQKEVEWVDERVGHILKALDRAGLSDNTIVVFTSDHGEAFGEHGYYLHGWTLYDEMVRVPLIVAGPGIPAGRRIDAPVSTVDLTPTLGDLIGCRCLKDVRGTSLKPLILGTGPAPQHPIYLANPGRQPGHAIVDGGYKLIVDTEARSLELYDLVADPGERFNLVEERRSVVGRMSRQLTDIRSADLLRQAQVVLLADGEALEQTKHEILRDLEAIGYLD